MVMCLTGGGICPKRAIFGAFHGRIPAFVQIVSPTWSHFGSHLVQLVAFARARMCISCVCVFAMLGHDLLCSCVYLAMCVMLCHVVSHVVSCCVTCCVANLVPFRVTFGPFGAHMSKAHMEGIWYLLHLPPVWVFGRYPVQPLAYGYGPRAGPGHFAKCAYLGSYHPSGYKFGTHLGMLCHVAHFGVMAM